MIELKLNKIYKYIGPEDKDRMVRVIGENGEYKLLRDHYHNYFITRNNKHILSILQDIKKHNAIRAFQEMLLANKNEPYDFTDLYQNRYTKKIKEYSESIKVKDVVEINEYKMVYGDKELPDIVKDDTIIFSISDFQDKDDIVTHYTFSNERVLDFLSLKGNYSISSEEQGKLQRIVEQAESYHAYCLSNNYKPPFTTIIITPEVEKLCFLQQEAGFIQSGAVFHNTDEFPLRSVGIYFNVPIFVLNNISSDFKSETISLTDLINKHYFILRPDSHKNINFFKSTVKCSMDVFSNVIYITALNIVKDDE